MKNSEAIRKPIVIPPHDGRTYAMGRMHAIFKADGQESADRYSVSEWWLEPQTRGPGVHFHAEDHVYYIISGTLTVWINEQWAQLEQGSYVVIPGGTPHDFRSQGSSRTGFISFNSPGGFETRMPGIAAALSAEDLRL